MHSLLKSLQYHDANLNYVLAIIVETSGSTYGKVGTMMLIDQNGSYWGLLSGGCLEGDVVIHSEKVIQAQHDKKVTYNMRDEADLLWGMGLGCDGEVTILLKYLPCSEQHFGFFDGLSRLESGISQYLVLGNESNPMFSIQNFEIKTSENKDGYSFLLEKPHHILICGGSPDVPPVTAIAHQIGWQTTVVDHREAALCETRFPMAHSLKHTKRSQWRSFELSPYDSAVVMSHQFERDQQYLEYLLSSPIKYIGLLGPAKRRDKLLAECNTSFSQQEGRVFGPIGLDIGGSSPELIALAIISEIQAVKNNKQLKSCYQDPER